MNLRAIILAAGQGTRMKSALPKVLHEVLGRPMIGHVLAGARAAGAEQTVIVVGHGREAVEDYIARQEGDEGVSFVVQEQQLGTAHAVAQAREALRDHTGWTLILSGDVPNLAPETLKAFVAVAQGSGHRLAFMSSHRQQPDGYGRIVRDEHGKVLFNVEHRDATAEQRHITEVNAGIYLVDNAFLWENLDRISTDNDQAEFYLPDLIAMAARAEGVTPFVVPRFDEVAGVNTRVQLAQAEHFARGVRNRALMNQGVTMIDPANTYVDALVELAHDILIEPGARLTGRTTVGVGCLIGAGAIVKDTVLESDVTIKPYSHLEGAVVRAEASVGPFANLRPGSDIGPQARVGNFVEIKKSTLGAGTKASHLSYLGDATIGDHCNIGAGTITCNYDGSRKHPTVMEDGVFVGSNSALVAPIRLKKGAYVGAGSTLTQDVEEGSLAVARGRQRNIKGWNRWMKKGQ